MTKKIESLSGFTVCIGPRDQEGSVSGFPLRAAAQVTLVLCQFIRNYRQIISVTSKSPVRLMYLHNSIQKVAMGCVTNVLDLSFSLLPKNSA